MNYDKMDDAELEAANQALMAERSAIGEEQEKIAAVLGERASVRKTDAILDGVGDDQIHVLIEAATARLAAGASSPGATVDTGEEA